MLASQHIKPACWTRSSSTEAGEGKTGHIHTETNEGIFFFGSWYFTWDHDGRTSYLIADVFPLRLKWLFRLPWQTERSIGEIMEKVNHSNTKTDPINIIQNAKMSASVSEILPRFKEGGAFVKMTLGAGESTETAEKKLKEYLKSEKIKHWWSPFDRIHAGRVQGKPWVEDLFRLPCSRLRVEFLPTTPGGEAAELSQEQLYSFFRPYGRLVDIVPQSPDSKVLPKFATIDFSTIRKAIMAKNCLHGLVVREADGGGKAGTILRLAYERRAKTNWIWDWISGHTRIVIPIVAALVAGITVAIFDP